MPLIADETILFESPSPEDVFCYTPSLCRGFDGRILAGFDLGGPGTVKLEGPRSDHGDYPSGNQLRILLSDDGGKNWRECGTRLPMLHTMLFRAGNALYALGHSGRLLISRSLDNGESWSEPSVLDGDCLWHQSAGRIDFRKGRLYAVYEQRIPGARWPGVAPVLMTAEETGISYTEGQTPEAVAFTFRHELARVNIIVQVDPGVEVTDLTATLSGYQEKGTLTRAATGATWTLDTSSTSEQTVEDISISGGTSHDLFGDLLLIPQSIEDATLVLNLKRNGDTENYTASLDESLTAWNAGQHYRYLLHISVDAITFSNFTVDDWGETHTGGDINIGPGTGNNVNNNGN